MKKLIFFLCFSLAVPALFADWGAQTGAWNTSPTSTGGSGSGSGTVSSGTSGYSSKYTGATTLGQGSIYDDGTNVGIGTSSPATKMHMSSGTLTLDGTTPTISVGSTSSPGVLNFSGPIGGIVNPPRITLAGGGSLGGPYLDFSSTTFGAGGARIELSVGTNQLITGSVAGDLAINSDTTGGSRRILFGVGNSNVMTVSDVNVGIGTLSPATKLHISSGVLTIDGSGAGLTVGSAAGGAVYSAPGSSQSFLTSGNTTPEMVLYSSSATFAGSYFSVGATTFSASGGNVSVGTNTAVAGQFGSSRFGVQQDAAGSALEVALRNVGDATNNSTGVALKWFIGTDTQYSFKIDTRGGAGASAGGVTLDYNYFDLIFAPNATERVRFMNGGNVGIGTSSPATKLHVSSGVITNNGSGAGITTTGSVTATGGIVGTTVAADPSAGIVGEYASSSTIVFSNVATAGQFGNVVTLSLTAGDWDVSGVVTSSFTTTQTGTDVWSVAISSFSANTTTDHVNSVNEITTVGLKPASTAPGAADVPRFRALLTAATNIYLKVRCSGYATATPKALGALTARRRR